MLAGLTLSFSSFSEAILRWVGLPVVCGLPPPPQHVSPQEQGYAVPSTSVPTVRPVLVSSLQPCRRGCGSPERWSDMPTVTEPGTGRIHTQVSLASGPALQSLLHGWVPTVRGHAGGSHQGELTHTEDLGGQGRFQKRRAYHLLTWSSLRVWGSWGSPLGQCHPGGGEA